MCVDLPILRNTWGFSNPLRLGRSLDLPLKTSGQLLICPNWYFCLRQLYYQLLQIIVLVFNNDLNIAFFYQAELQVKLNSNKVLRMGLLQKAPSLVK